jgi:hypothetical protein
LSGLRTNPDTPFGLIGWAVWLRGRYLGEVWGWNLTASQAVADEIFGIAPHHQRYCQAVKVTNLVDPVKPPAPPKDNWGTPRPTPPYFPDPEAIARQKARAIQAEIDAKADEETIIKTRKNTPAHLLSWVQLARDRIPERWHAFGATRYGVGIVSPDGSWSWSGHADGSDHERGKAETVEAAKALIDARWAAVLAIKTKPMTEAQQLAAYRKMLISRVRNSEPDEQYRAITAIKTLERCGWLSFCPDIDSGWIGYIPEVLLIKLKALGKLPDFADVF